MWNESKPYFNPRPPLDEEQILEWADAHYARTGEWPDIDTGFVTDAWYQEKWYNVDKCLRCGIRGLRGDSSLAQFLEEHRGVPNRLGLPRLTEAQILVWAEAHYGRTGAWPAQHSGPVVEAPDETWRKVDTALRQGLRGLSPGSSLAQLLTGHRRMRRPQGRVAWPDRWVLGTPEKTHV